MRILGTILAATLLWFQAVGCDCHDSGVSSDCEIAGLLRGHSAEGTPYSHETSGAGPSCLPRSVSFGARQLSGRVQPLITSADLGVGLRFPVRPSADPSTSDSPPFIDLDLTIRNVPLGSSQIDLDDTRASLEGWNGVRGQLEITSLSRDCSHGNDYCLLDLHAMVDLSASAFDGATMTLTGGALDIEDRYWTQPRMCAPIGE